jgi:RecJ-like exonuclease
LGSGKHHKKNKPCRVCGGSGKVTNTFVEESKKMIQAILEAEMSQKIEETIRQSFMNQSQMHQPSSERHEGIPCSHCGVDPIVGARYMCPQRKDYNLCHICEEFVESEHALLKVKASRQAADYLSFSLSQSQLQEEVVFSVQQLKSEKITPILKPGQKVSEFVLLQNNGTRAWPASAVLKFTGGVNFL